VGRHLVSRRGLLDVVVVQELHDVQDGDLRSLIDAQDLAQSRVGEDLLALHQAMGLGVGVDTGIDVLAADLGVLGQTQERLQLVGNGQGDREGLATITLALAGALLGLLREASRQLLNRLGQTRSLNGEGLLLRSDLGQAGNGLVQGRDSLVDNGLRRGGGGGGLRRSGRRHRGGDGRRSRRRNDSSSVRCLRGLGSLGGLGRRCSNGGGNGLNLGRSDRLGGSLGGGLGSAHFDVVGGSGRAHGTRE
jgi:hypothetical protein